jgi:hypothetical protein
VRHFKYENLTTTVDCPEAREIPRNFPLVEFSISGKISNFMITSVIVTLITFGSHAA